MNCRDIRRHLKAYSIVGMRTTTMNHAFAAAIAPSDVYEEQRIREAIRLLGQDPDDLACAYCAAKAETWDHIHATVSAKVFSGFGHRLGNLLPCCKPCNSRKGNRSWLDYLQSLGLPPEILRVRREAIQQHIERYGRRDRVPDNTSEYAELQEVKAQVLQLLKRADDLASSIRKQQTAAAGA